MLILVLDSCSSACSVGVWRDGRIVARSHERMERGQDARLMPMVVDVMERAGVTYDNLDRIAATRGPGSFTGVRVCLATARGLGLASGKPVIGVDRFSIYRELRKVENRNLLVVINSKRAELFCRYYPANGDALDPALLTDADIRTFLAQHPATDRIGDMGAGEEDILAACALLAAQASPYSPEFQPSPLYLRPPDVTVAKS